MVKLYMLQHEYEYTYENGIFDEVKLIGIFSSLQKAEDAKNLLKNKKSFKDFPDSCFIISDIEIDSIDWVKGFIPTEEA